MLLEKNNAIVIQLADDRTNDLRQKYKCIKKKKLKKNF